tara:strand:+ start:9186 stop:10949 length:1764 start_codon:yes stop_codon:yes gene_type:complete
MNGTAHRRRCCFTIIQDNEDEIHQPESIKTQLFIHQKKAISRMRNLELSHLIVREDLNRSLKTNYGIYADKVGAGKTLAMTALVATSVRPRKKCGIPLNNTGYTVINQINDKRTRLHVNTTLIIVPHSLMTQWVDTLKMVDGLKFFMVNTNKLVNKLVKTILESRADAAWGQKSKSSVDFSIVLISNTMARKFWIEPYQTVVWDRVIVDEPHTFVLNDLPEANFCWFVCATPYDILYSNRQWLRCTMGGDYYYTKINPNELAVIKNSDDNVNNSLCLPPYKESTIKCLAPIYLRNGAIRNNLPAEALSRLNGNDVTGALEILNCDANSKSSIVESLISNYRDLAHNETLSIQRLSQIRNITNTERAERIKRHQEKLDDYLKKVADITERVNTEENCPICLDSVDDPCAIMNCCQKSFCLECILMSLKNSNKCPMCKAVTRVDSLHIQSDTNANKRAKKESGLLSKSNTLLEIVKNMKEDSRYLIFSEYDGSFRRISYKLSERAIPFKVLTGNCNAQQKIIQQYKDGEVKILMLNATNFGAGLNLQMTTDIIIYHEFRSKDLKTQVIGRAQRPGRTCPLTVTYLEHDT